jgi:hypothetical protein
MIINTILYHAYGTFISEDLNVTEEEYNMLLEMSKNFWQQDGMHIFTNKGLVVIPPNLLQECILEIKILNNEQI